MEEMFLKKINKKPGRGCQKKARLMLKRKCWNPNFIENMEQQREGSSVTFHEIKKSKKIFGTQGPPFLFGAPSVDKYYGFSPCSLWTVAALLTRTGLSEPRAAMQTDVWLTHLDSLIDFSTLK